MKARARGKETDGVAIAVRGKTQTDPAKAVFRNRSQLRIGVKPRFTALLIKIKFNNLCLYSTV